MGKLSAIFHSKTVAALSSWLGLMTVVYTGVGIITPEWFGDLTWPQLVLLSWGAALGTSLILSVVALIGAFAFRLLKPSSETESMAAEKAVIADSKSSSRGDVSEINVNSLREETRTVGKRVTAMQKSMAVMLERLDEHEELSASKNDLASLRDQLTLIRTDLSALEKRSEKALDDYSKSIEKQMAAIRPWIDLYKAEKRKQIAIWGMEEAQKDAERRATPPVIDDYKREEHSSNVKSVVEILGAKEPAQLPFFKNHVTPEKICQVFYGKEARKRNEEMMEEERRLINEQE